MSATAPRRRRDPEQTRAAIIDAALGEIGEGRFDTTSREIAARADVSERSVFVHFPSLDDLRVAVAHEQAVRVEAQILDVDPTGSLEARIAAVVRMSERVYDLQRNTRLIGMIESRRIPEIDASMRRTESRLRTCVAAAFAPEIAAAHDVDTALLDALDTLVGWSGRHHLAERRGLDRRAVSAVLTRGLTQLLSAQHLSWKRGRPATGGRPHEGT